jgi:hypothetical protein
MTGLLCVAVEMILSLVHFAALFTSMEPHLAMSGISMTSKVFRVSE